MLEFGIIFDIELLDESEIIFNVWLRNQKEEIKEIPYIHMEEIDWKKKGMAFLKAKFGNKKYEGSF